MNDPYVATPRGFRRKIGPKSKYGMNDNEPAFGDGIGPQGAQSSGNARSSFSGQKVGTPMAKRESSFSARMRESREVSEANAATEAKEKERTAKAKAAETERKETRGTNRQAPPFAAASGRRPSAASGIGDMLKDARMAGMRKGRVPYRSGMK